MKEEVKNWFMSLQDNICDEIEKTDAHAKFKQDDWIRANGGGGRTRILENGNIIEKGGVNFSAVHGSTPKNILDALNLSESDFFATGVSIVMHPTNPMVPIIHMNVRYFEMSNGTSWFGGGIDLTPHYVSEQDSQFFHTKLKAACDKNNLNYYKEFKKWADDYFYIKHRKETRGIGGIFFDRLSANNDFTMKDRWDFVKEIGNSFAPIYTHFMSNNHSLAYGDNEKEWQLLRRGRYVEFNLVLDKGTKFGLDTDGRTESILMSLPPQANWGYNISPIKGSKEQETIDYLVKGIDWINK
jgi:coproporphyrinogen III oxidase